MGTAIPALSPEDDESLIAMCEAGRLYDLESWIREGRALTGSGRRATALEIAVRRGFHSLVELCLRHESSQHSKNLALTLAVDGRRADLAELALTYGADIHAVCFFDALASWNSKMARLFMEHGADPIEGHPFANAFSERVRTSLGTYLECKRSRPALATALQAQADMALRKHALDGNTKWVSLMLWIGANPRTRGPVIGDTLGREDDEDMYVTALSAACDGGNPEVLAWLKPDPSVDPFPELIEECAGQGHAAVLRVLLERGAAPAASPDGGSKALTRSLVSLRWEGLKADAAPNGTPPRNGIEVFRLLVTHGARWRPEAWELTEVRRALYERLASHTIDVVEALVVNRACDDAVLRALMGASKMQQHVASSGHCLRRLGLLPNGRRIAIR